MTMMLKRLSLHESHAKAHAHFGAFGEWEVPVYFSSILEEHEAVRTRAGLFDISHMGELYLEGERAKDFLDFLLPRRIERLQDGKAFYAPLLNEQGGVVDDLIVYQIHAKRFLLIVNASTIEKDFQWFQTHLWEGIEVENASEKLSLFALQGPQSLEIARLIFSCDFSVLGYYRFLHLKSRWGELLISRTGYTGEDGLEILANVEAAPSLWLTLLKAGKDTRLVPVGFGARDTLRLEAGMLLYGQDMDDTTSAVEASLEWAVDFEKPHFMGRERNLFEKEKGALRRLVGFEMVGRGIPRHGFSISKNSRLLGNVTSGSYAPTLKKHIGLAYVPSQEARVGNEFDVEVRGQGLKAKIIPLPFYKRGKRFNTNAK